MRYNPAQAQPTTNIPPAQGGNNPSPYMMPQQAQRAFLPPGMMMAPRGYAHNVAPGPQPIPAATAYYPAMVMGPTQPQMMMPRPQMLPTRQGSSSSVSSMPAPSPISLSLYPSPEDYNDLLGDPRLYDDIPDGNNLAVLGRKVSWAMDWIV